MTQAQYSRISDALQAIGDAARLAAQRGDDLGPTGAEHSISSEEHAAQVAAFHLIATEIAAASAS